MASRGPLTPAEQRLALLFFSLSLLGTVLRGVSCLDPRVEAWLLDDTSGRAVPATGVNRSRVDLQASPETGFPGPESPSVRSDGVSYPDPDGGNSAASGTVGGYGNVLQPTESLGIDPNRATREELMSLPGIGPALAGRILADRDLNGPYRSADDLLRVRGIGISTLKTIRSRLSLP